MVLNSAPSSPPSLLPPPSPAPPPSLPATMSSGLPLRDRLQSNSPDPPQHDSPWVTRSTTPLRIAKRDSPQGAQLARRQSSSYKHMRNNNLVSKSPFRSQLPTPAKPTPLKPSAARQSTGLSPSPRKVSGEKRPRPHSMVATENEHPLGFKRRQSRAFQGLLEKEPVTKSPFRVLSPDIDPDDALPPPLPPKITRIPALVASPGRSSLVSKRLHGPRTVGNGSLTRRQRRKTVTFDERCDVMEFERDEDEDVFDSEDDYGDPEPEHAETHHLEVEHPLPDVPSPMNESFDSSHTGNDSITGLVESLLHSTEVPHTPPRREHSLPPDTETEDGVPYGRSHHVERISAAHRVDSELVQHEQHSFSTSTPPRSRSATPEMHGRSPSGTPEHVAVREVDEDVRMLPPSPSPAKAKRASRLFSTPGEHVLMPKFSLERMSMSPRETSGESNVAFMSCPLHSSRHAAPKEDPFSLPHIKDEPVPVEISFISGGSASDDCMDPANLSIGHSEVSLEGLDREHSSREEIVTDDEELLPPQPPFFHAKAEDGIGSVSSRTSTPLERSDSHASTSQEFDFTSPVALRRSSSPKEIRMPKAVRPEQDFTPERILPSPRVSPRASPAFGSRPGSRNANGEEAQRPHPLRTSLERRAPISRTDQCPVSLDLVQSERDVTMHEDARTESDRAQSPPPVPPSLSREKNYTYDGVMELDPEPQPIDPPRPDALVRAHSSVDERERLAAPASEKSAFLGIEMEFGGGGGAFDGMSVFGRGAGRKESTSTMGDVHLGDVSALDRLMENAAQGSAQLAFPQTADTDCASRSASPSPVSSSVCNRAQTVNRIVSRLERLRRVRRPLLHPKTPFAPAKSSSKRRSVRLGARTSSRLWVTLHRPLSRREVRAAQAGAGA